MFEFRIVGIVVAAASLCSCGFVCFCCVVLCVLCLSVWLCLFFSFCIFVWGLLLLHVRVKFETAHCQPVISVTRNKSDKSEFIPQHKLNVNAFGKNWYETSISRILCLCFDQLVFVIA